MKKIFLILLGFMVYIVGTSCDDDVADKEKPQIDITQGAFQNCSEVIKGEPFTFTAVVSDNEALASYAFDIHHNFDHHNHSTESEVVECQLGEKKDAIKPFKLVWTKSISGNPKTYTLKEEFTIPEEFEAGDYHLMFKVVDQAGWATMKGLSFKIIEK